MWKLEVESDFFNCALCFITFESNFPDMHCGFRELFSSTKKKLVSVLIFAQKFILLSILKEFETSDSFEEKTIYIPEQYKLQQYFGRKIMNQTLSLFSIYKL